MIDLVEHLQCVCKFMQVDLIEGGNFVIPFLF
jgi:hypothetical protein